MPSINYSVPGAGCSNAINVVTNLAINFKIFQESSDTPSIITDIKSKVS